MPRGIPNQPRSDPDAGMIMADQLDDPSENQPMPEPVPAWRPASLKYYFRTDPGHRERSIRIPGVLDSYPEDVGRDDEKALKFYTRKYERKYTAKQRANHEAVREANKGEWFIRFQHIPNKFEAYLETDSLVLANYIRGLIASGELPYVYEDARVPKSIATPQMPAHRAVAALRIREYEDANSPL